MIAPIDNDILMNICPTCSKKEICIDCNDCPNRSIPGICKKPVKNCWYGCEPHERIAKRLLSEKITNPYSHEHRCDKCNDIVPVTDGRWIHDVGVWVCYRCYPKTKAYGKNEFY